MMRQTRLRSKVCGRIVGLLLALQSGAWAVTTLAPGNDDQVLEVLPAVTRNRPVHLGAKAPAPATANPVLVAQQARDAISVARQTGDSCYWGRAQAVLAPWWDRVDAPPDLAVLQATVQQGRHEFDAARKLLTTTLQRSPGHAQGWLNLAALERLSGRYAESLRACAAVARAGQALYAQACQLETRSLQGDTRAAGQGLRALLAATTEPGQRSWLLSLLAEHQERAGDDSGAARAYRDSLEQEADLYTAIAYSDLLLRTGRAALALRALEPLPMTDAVLLRRAAAWRRSGDSRWSTVHAELRERAAELKRRGDDPTLHGRELALAAWWLADDAQSALQLARANLLLQREPVDWWLAISVARQARDTTAVAQIEAELRASGLHDTRLALVAAAKPRAWP